MLRRKPVFCKSQVGPLQLCDPGRREERAIVIKARVTRVTTPLIVVKVRMIVIPATLIVIKARVTVITTPLIVVKVRMIVITATLIVIKARVTVITTPVIVIKVRVTVITTTLIVIKARVTVITTPVIVIKVRVTVITTPVIVVKVRVTVITTPVIVIKVRVTVITALVIVVKVRVTVITTRVTVIKGLGTVITRSDSYLARRDTGLASATVIFAARKRSRTRLAKSRSDRDAVAGWVALLAPLVAAPPRTSGWRSSNLDVVQPNAGTPVSECQLPKIATWSLGNSRERS